MIPRHALQLAVVMGVLCLPACTTLAQATFEYAAEPDALVIQLSRDVGIADADPTPLLRIYGDGVVRVHFPVYMRRAGDYTLQLDPTEVEDLVGSIVEGGLIDFSREAVQAQIRGITAARRADLAPGQPPPLPTLNSDPVVVTIEVHLRRYTPSVGAARSEVTARLMWADAQGTANTFPTLETLQALAVAERRLLVLTERDDLTPVEQ